MSGSAAVAMGGAAAVEHLLPHVLAMGLVPLLLVRGAPPALLASRWVRRASCRWHPVVHALEHYGGMAAFVLTPWSAAAMRSPVLHAATHAWMLACGLCFSTAVLGPAPGASPALSARARRWLVAAGAPLGAVLALAVVAGGATSSATAQGWVLAVGGVVTTAAGLVLLQERTRTRTPGVVAAVPA